MGEITLQFLPEPGHTPILNQVFHAGMAPLLTIAMIPLQSGDRLHQIQHVIDRHPTERVGAARKGLVFVVGASHAATHVDVAAQGAASGIAEQHQTDVLGEQIHRVVTGNGDGDLELAWQVGGAVEGFGRVAAEDGAFALARFHLPDGDPGLDPIGEIAINPEIEIGALRRLGCEQVGDVIGQLPGGGVATALGRCRRRHHVAVDVAAGGEGGAHRTHDGADHLAQIRLGDAMHLEGLAGGGPEGAIAEAIGQVVEGQIEGGGDAPTGAAQPQHHLPVLLDALAAVVAVVLLIAAVKLQDLDGRLGEMAALGIEFAEQRFLEVTAGCLEGLELGRRRSDGRVVGDRRRGHRFGGIRNQSETSEWLSGRIELSRFGQDFMGWWRSGGCCIQSRCS